MRRFAGSVDALQALAGFPSGGAVLWRGMGGSDLDVLVVHGAETAVAAHLRSAGLVPVPRGAGHVTWAGATVPVDVIHAGAWPPYYPRVSGVMSRCLANGASLPVASAEDRLLILGAEAVLGRPLTRVAHRCRALLDDSAVPARLQVIAEEEGALPLAEVVADPLRLERMERRGRLPLTRSIALALRCKPARSALRARVRGRLGAVRARGAPLIALSGMDGAGKSSLAGDVQARLVSRGVVAEQAWARIAAGDWPLVRPAVTALKRLLRRQSVADPVAANAPSDLASPPPQRDVIGWTWVLVVTGLVVRDQRRTAARARRGVTMICDRWAADALVDLRLRYGRHRPAEWMLAHLVPRADLAVILEIEPETSTRRKPGDQAEAVLTRMAALYSEIGEDGWLRIDARRPQEEVAGELFCAVDELFSAS